MFSTKKKKNYKPYKDTQKVWPYTGETEKIIEMVSEEVQILSFKSIILNMPEKLKKTVYTEPKENMKITSR